MKKTTEDSVKKEPAPKSHLNLFKIATFSLASIATLSAIGAIYLNVQLRQQLTQQTDEVYTSLHTLKQQQITTNTSLKEVMQETNQTQTALTDKINTFNQNLQKTLQQRWYQNNDWVLRKVRYYLELAQVNAHWSDQTQTTIALLQEADNLLSSFHEEQLLNVRQSIAQEISELKSAAQIDMIKLLSQLDALQNQVLQLPTKITPTAISESSSTRTAETQVSNWRAHLQQSLQSLEKLVIVQHHEEDVQPILTNDYLALVRENIRLSLQEAQWAILRLNNELYHLLLKQAIANIQRSFDAKASKTQSVLQQLDDMQGIELSQAKISLNASLTLLNQFIDAKEIKETADEPATSPIQEPTP